MKLLPMEIWLHIATFISQTDLRNLLTVNRVFFDIAMDIRYRRINISNRSHREAIKFLGRLKDPTLACRVRSVYIELTHAKEKKNDQSSASSSQRRSAFQLGSVFNRAFANSSKIYSGSKKPGSAPETPTSFVNVLEAFIEAFPGMVNVREFSLDSWDIPSSYDLRTFFSAAWLSFGRHLTTVSLGGNLEGYRILLESNPPFESVTNLRLEFTNNLHRGPDDDADITALLDVVAPFLNGLAPQLLSLTVWSWVTLDLSSFFMKLGSFHGLQQFNIRTAFNRAFRRNPSGLKSFLAGAGATLERLEMRLNPVGLMFDSTAEDSLGQWLIECGSDGSIFKNLRILDIYPTNLPSGLHALANVIHHTTENLTLLIVRDHYFHTHELSPILDALSSCSKLHYLRVNVLEMSAELFDRLALKLPNLKNLGLFVNNLSVANLTNTFRAQMATRSYTSWKLEEVGIFQGGTDTDPAILQILEKSIPSLQRSNLNSAGH